MYLKFALIVVFALSGCLIGNLLRKKDLEKENYFFELKTLATTIICEIRFSLESIGSIIERFDCKSQLMNVHKNQFLKKLHGEKQSYDKGWLTPKQYITVQIFFNNLGKYDLDTQIFQIEAQMDKLTSFLDQTTELNKKQGMMKVKIGCLLGVGIGILIL